MQSHISKAIRRPLAGETQVDSSKHIVSELRLASLLAVLRVAAVHCVPQRVDPYERLLRWVVVHLQPAELRRTPRDKCSTSDASA